MPEADRRLIWAPIRLGMLPDAEALRRRLGTAQAKIAQAPDATKGGNSTKRIRLRVDVPGHRQRQHDSSKSAYRVLVTQMADRPGRCRIEDLPFGSPCTI